MLSNQEIFDKVSKHLLTQMKKSMSGETCLYRGPNGLKCAIGALIPDEFYDEAMESSCAFPKTPHHQDAMSRAALRVGRLSGYLPVAGWDKEYSDFLDALQNIHDSFEPEQWKEKLQQFAQDKGLIFNGS
jgi:hypothetical protein